jgi:glycerophosphoryl diester phosphodiesterase
MIHGDEIAQQRVPPFKIIAHRCMGFTAEPNSAMALRAALGSSVDEVELDFRLTQDGCFVAAHLPWYRAPDGRLYRVAAVSESRAREHGRLSLGEALEIVSQDGSRKRLRLEIKGRGAEEVVLKAVHDWGVSDRVTIVSWNTTTLRSLRAMDATIQLGYSFLMGCQGSGFLPFALPRAIPVVLREGRVRVDSINIVPLGCALNASFVSDLRSYNVEICLVTSYGLWTRKAVVALGVDGVLTSEPTTL